MTAITLWLSGAVYQCKLSTFEQVDPALMLMIDVQRFFVTVVIISQKILNFVLSLSLSLSISLSISTAIFPGEPGLDGFIAAKDDGSGSDYWNYKSCKAPVKSSPPTANFLEAGCPSCRQTNNVIMSMHRRQKKYWILL